MSTDASTAQRLAENLVEVTVGQSLRDYVIEKRFARPRWPWRLIAEQLTSDTDGKVTLSHEALRQWYPDEVAA